MCFENLLDYISLSLLAPSNITLRKDKFHDGRDGMKILSDAVLNSVVFS